MTRGLIGAVLVAAFLAGCSGSVPTIATPLSSVAATHSPADVARIVGESIDLLYCGAAPKPAWCASLSKVDAHYDIGFTDPMLAIGTHALSAKLAADLCASVAAADHDDNAVALGFTHVVVVGPGQKVIAKCNTGN